MQQPAWYLKRLRSMSGAEIAYRITRGVRVLSTSLIANDIPARDELATDLRFLPPFVALSPDLLITAAERVIAGRYSFFDLEDVDLGNPPQWNRDPLTHRIADMSRRALTLDYRDERVVGNIKYLWEQNRHLHLPVLAQAFVVTGDPRYADTIQTHIDSWIEQCPAGRGANWVSALEPAIRLINWSLTWQLLGGSRSRLFATESGVAFRDRWLRSVFEQSRMIMDNPSKFSSANNHLIGESVGVFVAASTWPLWAELRDWGQRCRAVLEEECLRQNSPDGGNREQAFAYQTFVLDFLIIAGLAARERGEDFSPLYWRRVEVMIDFLASMTDGAGRLPMIGDADDGKVIDLAPERGFSPHASLIATGALLFGRADLAAKAGALDGKTVSLLGVQAVRTLANLKEQARGGYSPQRQFTESGYYLLGTAFDTPDEVRMLVDAGPLGYLSIAAHGHADALSFTLSIGDREILIDPGTYSYHSESEWRRYFRGTSAHNTIGIDEEDQSVQAGNFMWTRHARARCLEFDVGKMRQRFIGEHSGYDRLTDPVIHRRQIDFDPDRQIIEVADTLSCEREHVARRFWHFAEDCHVERLERGLRITTGRTQVLMEPQEELERVDIHRAGSAEQGGWVSRRFGCKSPTATVVWQSAVRGLTVLRTRISYARARPLGL